MSNEKENNSFEGMNSENEKYEDFYEELNKYYSMRNEYNSELRKEKKDIKNNKNLSESEKKIEIQNIKQKCVSCKRRVGTIFLQYLDKENNIRHLIAKCGDEKKPCGFKIDLELGYIEKYINILNDQENDIKKMKNILIKTKNMQVFNFLNDEEALTQFNEIKSQLDDAYSIHLSYSTDYYSYTENEEIESKLEKLNNEINFNFKDIKELLNTYYETRNSNSLKIAINKYIYNILPKMQQVRDIKYSKCYVSYDELTDTHTLIQHAYGLDKFEVYMNDPKINIEKSDKSKSSVKYLDDEENKKNNEFKEDELIDYHEKDGKVIECRIIKVHNEDSTNEPYYTIRYGDREIQTVASKMSKKEIKDSYSQEEDRIIEELLKSNTDSDSIDNINKVIVENDNNDNNLEQDIDWGSDSESEYEDFDEDNDNIEIKEELDSSVLNAEELPE